MRIGRLAHIRIGAGDAGPGLARFYAVLLGVVEVGRQGTTTYLSGGKKPGYDLAIASGPAGLHSFAFEVEGARELSEATDRLERAGVPVARLDGAADHGITQGIEFVLPSGHAMQLVVLSAPEVFAGTPTVDSRHFAGVGPVDLEHLSIDANDVEELATFLVERLGFRISDYSFPPGGPWFLAFLRTNTLHHDLGLFRHSQWSGPGFNHIGFAVPSIMEIARVADLAAAHGWKLQCSPGRHLVGDNIFAYLTDPSGNRVEVGTPMTQVQASAPARGFDSSGDANWGGFDAWRIGIPPTARAPGACRNAHVALR